MAMVEPAGRSVAARELANKKKSGITSTGAAMTMKKKLMSKKPEKEKDGSGGGCRTTRKQSREPESPSYRLALKSIFSCRNSHQQPDSRASSNKLGCSAAPSICKLKDSDSSQLSQRGVAQRPPAEDETAGEPCKRRASVSGISERCVKKPLSNSKQQVQLQRGGSSLSSSSSSGGGSFRAGMQLRRLSGCYECHMVVDPGSGSSSMRAATVCPCPDCGEIFVRQESLQIHQSIRHAVSELGADDTSRNIIEIIFQSSWLKKQSPVCKVERILKVHNTPRTLARFEEYRDAVKAKAAAAQQQQAAGKAAKHPRCTADGNELLRFHCATLACELGLNGATHLCSTSCGGGGGCGACAIIRDGFKMDGGGVRTMATSGRAHDDADLDQEDQQEEERRCRAMLVCRVIAGRVKRATPTQLGEEEASASASSEEEFDSVAASAPGVYSNLEELQVFNPRAILPCFVVVYKAA